MNAVYIVIAVYVAGIWFVACGRERTNPTSPTRKYSFEEEKTLQRMRDNLWYNGSASPDRWPCSADSSVSTPGNWPKLRRSHPATTQPPHLTLKHQSHEPPKIVLKNILIYIVWLFNSLVNKHSRVSTSKVFEKYPEEPCQPLLIVLSWWRNWQNYVLINVCTDLWLWRLKHCSDKEGQIWGGDNMQ